MSFAKMQNKKYPLRHWSLVGYASVGKSTFASQMRGPILAIDADHRFAEVSSLASEVYALSEIAEDNVDPDRITAILMNQMPNSHIGTIVIDSLTAIITPLVVKAMMDKEKGREKNLAAAFRTKALAMRQLQDAVTRWGTDVLWVYHLDDARNAQGDKVTKATVSTTELARLMRSINMQLQIVQQDNKRGIKVAWARRGRSGMTLWDNSDCWRGMPEKIESAVYDGLTNQVQDQIEKQIPDLFPNAETAIAWGIDRGAFRALQHSRNAYEKLKREHNPQNAREMAALWIADVQARLTTQTENLEAESASE